MNYTLASRMKAFQPSIFTQLANYKKEIHASGKQLIDLSIGSPDLPPPQFIMDQLAEEVKKEQYGYAITSTDDFSEAVVNYYKRCYGVILDKDEEVMQVIGSQDGLVHLPMAFANEDDLILVPDPGYTAYATGVAMAGAKSYYMPILKENDYLPDLNVIPDEIAKKAKMIILNYPGNPIPKQATKEFFQQLVAFAKRYNIIVLHDFAYSEFYYDGKKPLSFLAVDGAKDVGLEINSLSKSLSLAGARIGYIVGNRKLISAFSQLKSNLDYGVFLPIQKVAVTSLDNAEQICDKNRAIFEERRNAFVKGLHSIGWLVDIPEGGMFVWAEIPEGYRSEQFAFKLIDEAGVVVTPGSAFGPSGEGYVRIALVQEKDLLLEAVEKIRNSNLF